MTGTGFAITDYVSWPTLSVMAMIGLMFVGASAGSPTGSVKIVRHLLVARILRRELRQTIHPELVMPIRLNGQAVEERTLRAVLAFVVLYIGIFIVGAALLAIDARFSNVNLGITDAVAASAGTLGNVGPGLGFAGPMGSYEPFSDFSKLVMALLMWIGRLEVLPVLVLLTRGYWRV
jgi:trk system potassium uptake protein TrkH